jgi:indole-3-glycerol phosphate synthase
MILDQIVDHKRRSELPALPPVDRAALRDLPPCRGFRAALARPAGSSIRVIAESKKGSPSKGIFTNDYDPVRNALFYVAGGASCLSVLTDQRFFFGHLDFLIDERQIAEARLAGADCVLLIVACLEDGQLQDLHGFSRELGLDVLVEVHDADEAARALTLGADLIGVNNRNLQSFAVSLETTFALLPGLLGGGRVLVSESGISHREECHRLEEAGVDAVLVGETCMLAADPAVAIKRLRGRIDAGLVG